MGKRRRRRDPVLPEAHEGSSRLTSTWSAEGPTYLEGQQGLALEEAAADLPLDLLQVELLRGLPALLHLVLAVGEDQWDQVTLHFVTDNMQVSDLRGIHGVAEGQEIQSWCLGQAWALGFGACAPASASWCEQAAGWSLQPRLVAGRWACTVPAVFLGELLHRVDDFIV